jgi:site-specific recombinase XerD
MMDNVSPQPTLAEMMALLDATMARIEGAYAPSSIRAYRADFAEFARFCVTRGWQALPALPQHLAAFVDSLTAGGIRSSASIRRAVSGICTVHKLNRLPLPGQDPEVAIAMKRMHRTLGRSAKQAQGIRSDLLERLLMGTEMDIRGLRDRALLQMAYDTLSRRSELVALRIEDIRRHNKPGEPRMTILLRRSKTDPEGSGRWLHLTDRTAMSVEAWLSVLGESEGYLFRGLRHSRVPTADLGVGQINRIFKRMARQAHVDDALISRITSHSCRVGAAQDLVSEGASLPVLMSKGRWGKSDTVMRYVEQVGFVA